MNGGLLALDLGISTGWGLLKDCGDFSTGVLHLGSKRGNTNGPRFMFLRAFMKEKFEEGGVKLVVYEQTLGHHKSSQQAKLSNGLVAVLEEEAAIYGVELVAVPNTTLKKYVTGSGRAKKPQMIRAAWDRWPKERGKWSRVKPNTSWCKVRVDGKNVIDPDLKLDLDYVTTRGKCPDDNQVDAVWLANWAVTTMCLSIGGPKPAPTRGTDESAVFTGETIPCSACGGKIKKTSYYCLWSHAPKDPDQWVYTHPTCLNKRDRDINKSKADKEKKKKGKRKAPVLKVHKGGGVEDGQLSFWAGT